MSRLTFAPRLHAVVGPLNAAAVGILAALGVCGLATPRGETRPVSVEPAPAVTLLVIDGLRADEAADAARMPYLASRPIRSTAIVETPVPCSAAAIETWVTGRVPSAWAMLTDFWTGPVDDGGLLAAVAGSGRRVAVCGPTLWTGRYGRWVTPIVADATMGTRDADVIEAAIRTLAAEEPPALLVVHLLSLDAAGHRRRGVDAALADADVAAKRLADAMPAGTALLVVSDHGRSDEGGHAGPEAAVRRTPVILVGPDAAIPPQTTQRHTHRLLAGLIGVPSSVSRRAIPPAILSFVGFGLLAASLRRPRPPVTAGDGARVGVTALASLIAVGVAWWADALAMIAAAVVTLAASVVARAARTTDSGQPEVLAGLATAAAAIAVPPVGAEWPAWPGPTLATVAALILAAAISAIGRDDGGRLPDASNVRDPAATRGVGILVAATPLVQTIASGQGLSLSTLDTRPAFAVIEPFGVAAATVLLLAIGGGPLLIVAASVCRRADAAGVLSSAAAAAAAQAAAFTVVRGFGGTLGGRATDGVIRLAAGWAILGLAVGGITAAGTLRVRRERSPSSGQAPA